jgi:hypothetical protein
VCRLTPEEPLEQARWINQDLERGEGGHSRCLNVQESSGMAAGVLW